MPDGFKVIITAAGVAAASAIFNSILLIFLFYHNLSSKYITGCGR